LVIVFVAGLIVGGFLGWRIVLAIITLGAGLLIYDRVKKRDDQPAWETGEREQPKPKKRKTIF
jgi:hypothetical protein